jgi:hypothetical protein
MIVPERENLPENSSSLCVRCMKLTTDRRTLRLALQDEKEKGFLVAEPYEQLKGSAEAGCALCSLLCNHLKKWESKILGNTTIECKFFALLRQNRRLEVSSPSSLFDEPLDVDGFSFNSRLAGTGSNRWENDMEFRAYTHPGKNQLPIHIIRNQSLRWQMMRLHTKSVPDCQPLSLIRRTHLK